MPPTDPLLGVHATTLANGLTVLAKAVPTAPVVTVQVWYRVGSADEKPTLNGISHQLEHLMFKGTRSRPVQFGHLFNALGSDSNAFTTYEQTAYFSTVAKEHMHSLLVLEADRMTETVIHADLLASEQKVVVSELQGYENDPGYRLERRLMRQLFPHHPYGLPVGGLREQVEALTAEQVRHHYRQHYQPGNATLVVVGDFETEQVLGDIEQIFGPLRGTSARTPTPEPVQATPQDSPLVLREPGSATLLIALYPLPPIHHEDVPALHLLDLILTEGRNARLEQGLVDSGLASSVQSYVSCLWAGGWYHLSVTGATDQDWQPMAQRIDKTIAALATTGVTEEELRRAQRQLEVGMLLATRDITSQGMQLGHDHTQTGDYKFSTAYLEQVLRVTKADIQRVAATYLTPNQQVLGVLIPTQGQSAVITSPPERGLTEDFCPREFIDPLQLAAYLPRTPRPQSLVTSCQWTDIALDNGLRLLLVPDSSTPTVSLSGYIPAGSEADPCGSEGLAFLTAENLLNGTDNLDALTLDRILEDCGADLSLEAYREGVLIQGAALQADLSTLLEVLAWALQKATFPADQLELTRQQALVNLAVDLDEPSRLAKRLLYQQLYSPGHPYHGFPTQASLERITQAEVREFYRNHYRPGGSYLCLVGNFEPYHVHTLCEALFAAWPGGAQSPSAPLGRPAVVGARIQHRLANKAQALTCLGHPGISRLDPCFPAALVLNQIIGGDTLTSRLGSQIRDRLGLTYGIYSYFQARRHAGPFVVEMQTDPEDTEPAIAQTLALLREVKSQGVSAAEVRVAQGFLASNHLVELAHPDSLSQTLLMNMVYGFGPRGLLEFPGLIQAVTLEEVNQAARDLLHPESMVTVTVGP